MSHGALIIFEDGLQIPSVKLSYKRQSNQSLLCAFMRNNRIP